MVFVKECQFDGKSQLAGNSNEIDTRLASQSNFKITGKSDWLIWDLPLSSVTTKAWRVGGSSAIPRPDLRPEGLGSDFPSIGTFRCFGKAYLVRRTWTKQPHPCLCWLSPSEGNLMVLGGALELHIIILERFQGVSIKYVSKNIGIVDPHPPLYVFVLSIWSDTPF